ncbi:hypothetical protein D3C72_2068920 [compost metagenome]
MLLAEYADRIDDGIHAVQQRRPVSFGAGLRKIHGYESCSCRCAVRGAVSRQGSHRADQFVALAQQNGNQAAANEAVRAGQQDLH